MDIETARDVITEFGVEEGDTFEYADDMDMVITGITRNSAGIRSIEYDLSANGKTISEIDDPADFAGMIRGGFLARVEAPEPRDVDFGSLTPAVTESQDDKQLVADGGEVVDEGGYTIEDYPRTVDENEELVGVDEWGAWYYDTTQNRIHNYRRVEAQDEVEERRTPLEETDGACEELSGPELADKIAYLDAITARGYELIHEHGATTYVVNALIRHGLSPGQAWAYFGVVLSGNSRNQWAKECGYSDHSAVSEAVRKAEAKIPQTNN